MVYRNKCRAFTLIELLVVIAIIAILAAILFPVFAQAREKARAISCVSNEKEVALAVIQYLQDFDDRYPIFWYNIQGEVNGMGGGGAVSPTDPPFAPGIPNAINGWNEVVYPYIKNTQVFFCPDAPPLKSNPVFLFYSDGFQKPNPFQADITVAIDPVIEKKLDALDTLESQFYEGGALGSADLMLTDPQKQKERRRQVREGHAGRTKAVADRYRDKLGEWYGKDKAGKIQHAEAFEICEYGRRPDKKELGRLFPFFEE